MVTCFVGLVSLKNRLVNLPETLAHSLAENDVLAQDVVVLLQIDGRQVAAGWTGHTSSNDKSLELDPAFARNIGAKEGSEVVVTITLECATANVIWVEPQSADDWEIMELHASFLELNLLSQIRTVSAALPLTIYLNANTTATIQVKKIEPASAAEAPFARISPDAEVIVSPKTRTVPGSAKQARSVTSTRSHSVGARKRRSIFLRCGVDQSLQAASHGLCAYVPAATLRSELGMASFIEVSLVLPTSLQAKPAENTISPPPAGGIPSQVTFKAAKSIVLRAISSELLNNDQIVLSSLAQTVLEAVVGSRAKITSANSSRKTSSSITCHPYAHPQSDKEIVVGGRTQQVFLDECRAALAALEGEPISDGLLLEKFAIELAGGADWTILSDVTGLSLARGTPIPPVVRHVSAEHCIRVKGVDGILQRAKRAVRRSDGLLLYGSRGSGKTIISREIIENSELQGFHVVEARSAQLSEERLPIIKDAINQWCMAAAWHEPSLIVLDDIDRLCPAEVEHADSTRARQIAEVLISIVKHFQGRHRISLLATCQSKEALHALLHTSHLFDEAVALKAPNKMARRDIARTLVAGNSGRGVDWLVVANLTEGYLAGDIEMLTERAKQQALVREMQTSSETPGQLTTEDFQIAIKGFTPASLRGIKLHKATVEWNDIGGLEDTRRTLLETLEWPTRYAPIFASCPLRLRSGLLLYGYPGCGKTLLASAVASECGLNFISVKGPEILNKYIGASEKSVRDLFDRAQAAKPCVLFFDEFDSIAPKRGHDSTGVTDRVVNQMLTQMDGAEGLDGVYVLAATSRPDLIDPALLRPGRLDKSLLCNMPTQSERLSILQALSRKLHLDPTVDQNWLADRTEGYSGADMQAVLYNAHLDAIHDVIAEQEKEVAEVASTQETGASKLVTEFTEFKLTNSKACGGRSHQTLAERAAAVARIESILTQKAVAADSKGSADAQPKAAILIKRLHLEASLQTTRPSIAKGERLRLDKIYHEFVDGRSADGLRDGSAPSAIGKRSTLG